MFQFPINPVVGQAFNPIPGVAYKWDGFGWVPTSTGLLSVGDADVRYLQVAGGNMVGTLGTGGFGLHTGTGSLAGAMIVYGFSPSSATISFHRPNAWGLNVGLDPDNFFRIGGFSDGTSVYRLELGPSGEFYTRTGITLGSGFIDTPGASPAGLYGQLTLPGTAKAGYSGISFPVHQSAIITAGYSSNSGFYDWASSQWMLMVTNGNLVVNGNVTAFSDERMKTNIRAIAPIDVAALEPIRYERTDVEATQVGVSAQELQKILPECVNEIDGKLSVDYGRAALVLTLMLAKKLQ